MGIKAGGILMWQSNVETRADKATTNADGRNMPGKVDPKAVPETVRCCDED